MLLLDRDVRFYKVRELEIKPMNGYKMFVMSNACYHFFLYRM